MAKHEVIRFRVSKSQLHLIQNRMEILGHKNRSDYLREAAINYGITDEHFKYTKENNVMLKKLTEGGKDGKRIKT